MATDLPARAPRIAVGLAVLALAVLPQLGPGPYALHGMILLFLSVSLGASWNLVGGFAGQYSVGHAAYFGVGAYTTLVLSSRGLAPVYGTAAAVPIAALLALAIGAMCFRLRGPYFVLASIAVAEILRLAALDAKSLTNGAEGILAGDLRPLRLFGLQITDFSTKVPAYYLGLSLALTTIAVNQGVLHSRLGYALLAIREDQDAAHSLGIPVAREKSVALVLSAALTALAGSFYALYVGFIDPPTVLGLDLSVQIVLTCIIGGIGTVMGPVVGALVLVPLSEALRSNLLAELLIRIGVFDESSRAGVFLKDNLAHAHVLIYGVLIVLVILYMPDGVLGFARAALRRRSQGTPPAVRGNAR